jgi:hypothetical protein
MIFAIAFSHTQTKGYKKNNKITAQIKCDASNFLEVGKVRVRLECMNERAVKK